MKTPLTASFTPMRTNLVQRKCASSQRKLAGGQCGECSTKGQSLLPRVTNQTEPSEVPPIVYDVLRSPGQPLQPGTRAFMEARLGHDFSQVRVHTDSLAGESARAVNALAYTVGRDVVFASGEYAPARAEGQRLLAHELAHVTQQHMAGTAVPDTESEAGDAHEVAADRAAAEVIGGPMLGSPYAGRPPALQRQTPGQRAISLNLPPSFALQQSQGELVIESFLNRMWYAQSKQEKPFQITPVVAEGLSIIFPQGVPMSIRIVPIFSSVASVMSQLKGKIPPTIDPKAVRRLDALPRQEKPLSETGGDRVSGEPAKPKFGPEGAEVGPPKQPEAAKGASEAMKEALEAAFEEFRKTKLGKQLEQSGKSYVFSKEGIPLWIIVTGVGLAFVAAHDPKLPSPNFALDKDIKIGFDVKGRGSDLPPLLRALVHHRPDTSPPADKSEVKVGVSITATNEAIAELAKAVGHFFAEAATWIAKGVVKAGTVIGKAANKIKWELLGLAGGAALGALIGGLAGGGLGAAIGVAVGAAIGLGAGLIKHLKHSP